MQHATVSAVVPVYAGEKFLPQLVEKLAVVRQQWQAQQAPLVLTEAVFVCDEPIDASASVLERLRQQYDWVKVVTLSKNFGQHPATIAGILHCSGDWIFTLDEDLQHDPVHFGELLRRAVETSSDILYAKPLESVHESVFRDLSSRLYKRLLVSLTNNPHIPQFNSFRLMRGALARAAASVCSHETYFDVALCWFSNRITSTRLPLKDRRFIETGKSGYNLGKLLSHARRLLVSSQTKVLRGGVLLGLAGLLLSVIFGADIVVRRLFVPGSIDVKGWTSQMLGTLFFGGLSAFFLGVCLEYLSNILLHTQGKPPFFVIDRSKDALIRSHFAREPADAVTARSA